MKVYISAALSSSENIQDDQARYELLARELEKMGFQVHLPHKKYSPIAKNHSSLEVFHGDMENLLSSNLVVALLDQPSLGVGAEIAIALREGISVYGFHSRKISRFMSGLLESDLNGKIFKVDGLEDIIHCIKIYKHNRLL